MSAHKEAWQVIMSAHALCPTERSHPDRMRWMADYFLANFAIEQPELAAPVKECLTAELPLPARDGDWAGDDWYTAATLRTHTARAVAAAIAFNGGAESGDFIGDFETAPVPKGCDGGAEVALATPPASAQKWTEEDRREQAYFDRHTDELASAQAVAKPVELPPPFFKKGRSYGVMLVDAWDENMLRAYGDKCRQQAVAPAQVEKEPVARLEQIIPPGGVMNGEARFDMVVLDRARCFDGTLLYTRPQAAQPDALVAGQGLTDAVEELMGAVIGWEIASTTQPDQIQGAAKRFCEAKERVMAILAAQSAPVVGGVA